MPTTGPRTLTLVVEPLPFSHPASSRGCRLNSFSQSRAAANSSNRYLTLVKLLANSRLHTIDEAASARHAWLVGALDSGVRSVYLILPRSKMYAGRDKIIAEFGGIGEIDEETNHLQAASGLLDKKGRADAFQPPVA